MYMSGFEWCSSHCGADLSCHKSAVEALASISASVCDIGFCCCSLSHKRHLTDSFDGT